MTSDIKSAGNSSDGQRRDSCERSSLQDKDAESLVAYEKMLSYAGCSVNSRIRVLQKALRCSPKNLRALDSLASLHESLGLYELAANEWFQILEIRRKRNVSCYVSMTAFETALEFDPNSVEAYKELLKIAASDKHTDWTQAWWWSSLEGNVGVTQAIQDLDRLFQHQLQEQKFLSDLQREIQVTWRSRKPLINATCLLSHQKKLKRLAEMRFASTAREYRKRQAILASLHSDIGEVMYTHGPDRSFAVEKHQTALAIHPHCIPASIRLGQLLLSSIKDGNQHENSPSDFFKDSSSKVMKAYAASKAVIARISNAMKMSHGHLSSVTSKWWGNVDGSSMYAALLDMLSSLAASKKMRLAENLLRDCSSAWPNNTQVAFLFGFCEMRLGKLKEAETIFQRCLRVEPNNSQALAGLTEVRLHQGLEGNAEVGEMILRAVSLSPQEPFVLHASAFFSWKSGRLSQAGEMLERIDGQMIRIFDDPWVEEARLHATAAKLSSRHPVRRRREEDDKTLSACFNRHDSVELVGTFKGEDERSPAKRRKLLSEQQEDAGAAAPDEIVRRVPMDLSFLRSSRLMQTAESFLEAAKMHQKFIEEHMANNRTATM
ncbi:hypothetical protein GUITHDRAFT_108126 [Guillardia theta CCMP2712]|uniref:Uncharacterized protein n=1 Tax=Guillardia theta (strain CCMP2712) TaxID=905079 RepID=L1JC42_GUITC|nr:hypothetical protein GUITHDRAFT_108126 [Guillardia theta CCMP2712]EKX46091.1 hypothetical protein GUITHDRAFT_108126 [Guillardia theta CCMP2712]|eukprot:XP_005833071.1 hypothetical protein GUITHDRAFT_108126 [Guillardia theta CCMP2712]